MSLARRLLLPLLALMSLGATVHAQLAFSPPSYDFGEVMLDSTRTTTVTLTSQIVQDVSLTSDSPHFTVAPATVSFAAVGESHEVVISYRPVGIGQHSGSVTAQGSIWGSATLDLAGRGVLVSLDTAPDSLLFGNVPVGQPSTVELTVDNTGTGAVVITDITTSDPQYTVEVDTLVVPEGGSDVLAVTFTPFHTGPQPATLSFRSNAPYMPEVTVPLLGTGTSEISGVVGGVWTAENSPYQIVGNVTVPEGATLTIEPGVEVEFLGPWSLLVRGMLAAEGSPDAPIHFTSPTSQGMLQSMGDASRVYLSHCIVDSIGDFQQFYDDFENDQLSGYWRGDGVISNDDPHQGQHCMMLYGYQEDAEATLGPFISSGGVFTTNFYWRSDLSDSHCYFRVYYRINYNSWTELYSSSYSSYWSYRSMTFGTNAGDIVEIRFLADTYSASPSYDEERVYLDEVTVNPGNATFHALEFSGGTVTLDKTHLLRGSAVYGASLDTVTIVDSEISSTAGPALVVDGAQIVRVAGTDIHDCGGNPVDITSDGMIELDHCRLVHNGGSIQLESPAGVILTYCLINDNTGRVYINAQASIDHCTITDNDGYGLYLEGNDCYNTLHNSIIWGNGGSSTSYRQILSNGFLEVYYTAIQRGTSGISGNHSIGPGLVSLDPLFSDEEGHLGEHSPCIDAAAPWEHDAYMPPGEGSIVADMGVYGGPGNGIWGGTPVPDGKPVIEHIVDIPQDQGGQVGLQYAASIFDGQHPAYDITRYSFWRAMDLKGDEPPEASDHPTGKVFAMGKDQYWEYVGEMVAQQFPHYAATVPTYADSCSAGTYDIEFLVIAHTPDDDIFFTSDPLAGHSVDNLAPPAPPGLVAEATLDGIALHWPPSLADDVRVYHLFRSLTPDMDVTAMEPVASVADTCYLDETVDAQQPYFYVVVAEDVHDNRSGPSVYASALAPVPVQLREAAAALLDGRPVVSWRLAADEAFAFRVERSTDGGPFVPVAGTVETLPDGGYRLVDLEAVGGHEYRYRVLARQDGDEWILFTSEPVAAPPLRFTLGPVYPNPFNPETRLAFTTTRPGRVTLTIHDLRGRRLATLVDANLPAGAHAVTWRGTDADGRSLGSGVYFARLTGPEGSRTVKLVLDR